MDWDSLRTNHDPADYHSALINFPAHVEQALELMKGFEFSFKPESIIVCGMGGSAIPGFLLKDYCRHKLDLFVEVANTYSVPEWVGKKTLAFVISYSGNTEEALSCLKELMNRDSRIVLISSGGLLEKAARKYGFPFIKAPAEFQPRAATPYLFTFLLEVLRKIGLLFPNYEEAVRELRKTDLKKLRKTAERLLGKYLYIFTPSYLESVGRRYQSQAFNENAKTLSKYSVLPEANHNELTAWGESQELPLAAIFLWDDDMSDVMKERFKFTMNVCKAKGEVFNFKSRGKTLLSKMLTLIYQGDMLSYYLSLLRGKNPLPVPVVESLKKRLAKKTGFKKKLVKSLGLDGVV
ncbi:hypothetical protein GF352_00990 [archaeon]|nr:hypothetical protein [archaeon]